MANKLSSLWQVFSSYLPQSLSSSKVSKNIPKEASMSALEVPEGFYLRPIAEQDVPQVLEIINWMIKDTEAVWRSNPDPLEKWQEWLKTTHERGYTAIGVFEKETNLLAGFASTGDFRNGDGYQFTVEITIGFRKPYTGRGLGKVVLHQVVKEAREAGFQVFMASISSSNRGSARFFKREGFTLTGSLPRIGFKHGAVLDLELWQLGTIQDPQPQ